MKGHVGTVKLFGWQVEEWGLLRTSPLAFDPSLGLSPHCGLIVAAGGLTVLQAGYGDFGRFRYWIPVATLAFAGYFAWEYASADLLARNRDDIIKGYEAVTSQPLSRV